MTVLDFADKHIEGLGALVAVALTGCLLMMLRKMAVEGAGYFSEIDRIDLLNAAAAIETLRRERDDWRGTAEHLLDIEKEWIDENSRLAGEYKALAALLREAGEVVEGTLAVATRNETGDFADRARAVLAKIKGEGK